MESLPTELELLQIQKKREIEHFRQVWLNHNAGLSQINQELGIENPKGGGAFEFNQFPTDKIKQEMPTSPRVNDHYSADIFESSEIHQPDYTYNYLPLLSPPPPSVAPSVKRHIADIEEMIVTDQFVFGIDDLEALAFYLKVDFDKLLKAATVLRNNGTLQYEEEYEEVIPCSQSPTERGDFWKRRISQTQTFIGK